jgi:hypothetical protein
MDSEKQSFQLYENTLHKMDNILKGVKSKSTSRMMTIQHIKNLKTELARGIRSLKPGILEVHLEKKKNN